MIWLELCAVSLVVIIFGYLLSEKAEKLAEARNLGKGLIGFVLLGFSTSVPELISTVSATTLLDNPMMGAGNIIGSNNANLVILFASLILAGSMRKKNNLHDEESLVSVSFCFLITAVFISALLFSGKPLIAGKSFFSHVLIVLFFLSLFELHRAVDKGEGSVRESLPPLFYILLAVFLLVLIGASYWLSVVVDRISRETGFGATASGALFLAWSTSLPELAVTVSTVIIGSSEMGIGNILGSNIFNMFILALSEILSRSSVPVFSNDEDLFVLSALQVILLSFLLLALSQKKMVRIWKISFIPACSILIYTGAMVLVI